MNVFGNEIKKEEEFPESKTKSLSPFDFVNAINLTKEKLFETEPSAEKDYVPFIVNTALSYFPDTLHFANEMNRYSDLPKKLQFEYYRNVVPRKKRFSKWNKKEPSTDIIEAVKFLFKYSDNKAREAISLLTEEEQQELLLMVDKGGKAKRGNKKDV